MYGVIQHRLTLEYQLRPFLRDPEKTENWVKELLYTAMYQLEYLDWVPKRAIFDETIKIAKVMGHDGTRRFVTGILHQMDCKGTPKLADIQDEKTRLSVEYSVPTWLVDMLQQQLGDKKTTSILASLNKAPKQSVRTNTAKIYAIIFWKTWLKMGLMRSPVKFQVKESSLMTAKLSIAISLRMAC